MDAIRVGVLGLGRSGYSIHCNAFQKLAEHYTIHAVADVDGARAAATATELGCTGYTSADALLADPQIELVVVSTYNNTHASNAAAALAAGKHVVCEKPFGLTVAEVDLMLAAARESGKVLAPFQNRRYEESYQKVRGIIASGRLGTIVHIRMHQHGFGRRWDWQTLTEFGGGQLNNNGPHLVDQALGLLEALGHDDVEALSVWAERRAVLVSGDAEDNIRFIVQAPNGPTVDGEFFATNPYAPEKWLVQGTAGGLRGSTRKLEWKWVDWSQHPERPVECASTPDRSYNGEKLDWQTDSAECDESFESLQGAFYTDLYRTIREGAPQVVTPESVRKRIRLIERIREAAAR